MPSLFKVAPKEGLGQNKTVVCGPCMPHFVIPGFLPFPQSVFPFFILNVVQKPINYPSSFLFKGKSVFNIEFVKPSVFFQGLFFSFLPVFLPIQLFHGVHIP
jgi:hypothetical protein